jgi:hypothetical protein
MSALDVVKKFSSFSSRNGVASGLDKLVNNMEAGQCFHFGVVIKRIMEDKFEIVQ